MRGGLCRFRHVALTAFERLYIIGGVVQNSSNGKLHIVNDVWSSRRPDLYGSWEQESSIPWAPRGGYASAVCPVTQHLPLDEI